MITTQTSRAPRVIIEFGENFVKIGRHQQTHVHQQGFPMNQWHKQIASQLFAIGMLATYFHKPLNLLTKEAHSVSLDNKPYQVRKVQPFPELTEAGWIHHEDNENPKTMVFSFTLVPRRRLQHRHFKQ
jgi:hypothetical protein